MTYVRKLGTVLNLRIYRVIILFGNSVSIVNCPLYRYQTTKYKLNRGDLFVTYLNYKANKNTHGKKK